MTKTTQIHRPITARRPRFQKLAWMAMMWAGLVTSAYAGVTVDQVPLTVQAPLPPNIVLMLDDSGSMAYDYMPDANYLTDTSDDGVRNAADNGTYYNPSVVYSPPPKANGTFYSASPGLTNAYDDGFLDHTPQDITQYHSSSGYDYYTRFAFINTNLYNPDTQQVPQCNNNNYPNYYYGRCYDRNYYRYISPSYGNQYVCDGSDQLNSNNKCVGTTTTYKYYFTYTTGPAAGPYVRHYVGQSGDCAPLPSADKAMCDDGATERQNVANWFSYYRTRMLLAKTGLMTSFLPVDASFRFGFGSINGRNDRNLPSDTSTYNGNKIAQVNSFGDGSSGTQKAKFWNWIEGVVPLNGTPLRGSLDAVGQYYQSSQPWRTSSSDNTELACRQSYTILTTDGFWNGSLSNTPGNSDNANGPTVTGPNGKSYTYKSAAPYSDSTSNTLADVAMAYWKNDLRPSVANEVPPSSEDPAFWQHMTTFTLGLGFVPSGIAPSGTTVDQVFDWANGGAPIKNFSWPKPQSDSINNIADLAHAAVNGHGGFYSATSPQSFTSGLQDALKRATERVGTGASLAANSTQLKTGTMAYQANYYTAKWKGDLKAFAVDPTTGEISPTTTWTAAGALPAATARNIYTYNPAGANAAAKYVPFTLPSKLSSAEASALGTTSADQLKMINYLRGDASSEERYTGGVFRNRDTPLGDVVNSQPIYTGTPDANQFYTQSFTGLSDFGTYVTDNFDRTPLVFVAANDGMLHAFNSETGAETYAFLPGAVITHGIKSLSLPTYGASTPHQFFNDGELTIADAYFASAWHTVLVGTTGRGPAKAVYALDVTDPSAIKFLWERSAQDGKTNSNYMGQMNSKPIIAQTADGVWSVVLGNGYNSSADVAALLQFNLEDGTLSVHATTDPTSGNGLAGPAVWVDEPSSGVSSVVYAGDLFGQVWSFSLNTGTTTATATPSSQGKLLFTAKDGAGKIQPITDALLVGKDPQTSNVWVFFGTGKYLNSGDLSDQSVQSWYGLIVQSSDATLVSNLSQGRSKLVKRSIAVETAGTTAPTVVSPARAISEGTPSDLNGKSGWYNDLISPLGGKEGERMVNPNQFQGSLLLGTTRIPVATDLCNPSGRGWIMAVDPFTGANPKDSFFDINGNGSLDAGDRVPDGSGGSLVAGGVGFGSLPNNPIFVGSTMLVSFDNGTTGSIKTSNTSGAVFRVSWRELINH